MTRTTARTVLRMTLRASPAQRRVLRQAAASSGRSMNAFVLDSACAAAYQKVAGHADFVMEDPDWEHILALLGRTAGDKDTLGGLLGRRR